MDRRRNIDVLGESIAPPGEATMASEHPLVLDLELVVDRVQDLGAYVAHATVPPQQFAAEWRTFSSSAARRQLLPVWMPCWPRDARQRLVRPCRDGWPIATRVQYRSVACVVRSLTVDNLPTRPFRGCGGEQ